METPEQIKLFDELFSRDDIKASILSKIHRNKHHLVLSFKTISEHSFELSEDLLEKPEDTLKAAELALLDSFKEEDFKSFFYIRVTDISPSAKITIREIRSAHLNKFWGIRGIVKAKSDVKPNITSTKYECPNCGKEITMLQLEQIQQQPSRCGCGRSGKFRLLNKELIDGCTMVLEEMPEDIKHGTQLKRLNVFVKSDLTDLQIEDKIVPGSRIEVHGILKEFEKHIKGGKSTTLDFFLEANYINFLETSYSDIKITDDEIEQIKELSKNRDILQKLTKSIFGGIYGYQKEKEAIVLQFFGGVNIESSKLPRRGEIHILLVGDPGSGKSTFLKVSQGFLPKSRYVAGRGSSGTGLTAAVVKDELIGGWTLEAGDLPLANNGILLLDELDKVGDEELLALHEPMEQGCYDDKTEVLTEKGWKLFKDLKQEDKVATLTKEGYLEYIKPTQYIIEDYNGKMFEIKSNRVDLLVTPNHNLYTSINKRANQWTKFSLHRADEVSNKKQKFKKNARWKGTKIDRFVIPPIIKKLNQHKEMIAKEIAVDMNDWLEFLGYYISEGSIQYHNKIPYSVYITQTKNKDKIAKINSCLNKLPFKYSFNNTNFQICNKQLSTLLSPLGRCHEKFVPNYIKSLDKKQIKIFIDALMLGDGYAANKSGRNHNSLRRAYTTTSKRLADDFQELLLKIGLSGQIYSFIPKAGFIRERKIKSTKRIYIIGWVIKSNKFQLNHNRYNHFSERYYNGKIYCVEVPNKTHTIYIRRNGKPIWCGNSVTISKANVHATLLSRTAILAAANPKFGRFDAYTELYQQMNFEPTLINRFDFVFPFQDFKDEVKDKKTALKVLLDDEEVEEITPQLIKKYISYAKRLKPKITAEIANKLSDKYAQIRQSSKGEKSFPISARQISAMRRIIEAHARMKLREIATSEDMDYALELILYNLKQIAIDPETGKVDMDIISTGISTSKRERYHVVLTMIEELENKLGKLIPIEDLVEELKGKMAESEIEEALEILRHQGEIYEPKRGFIQRI